MAKSAELTPLHVKDLLDFFSPTYISCVTLSYNDSKIILSRSGEMQSPSATVIFPLFQRKSWKCKIVLRVQRESSETWDLFLVSDNLELLP